jgi:hypothetical protein
MATTTTTTIISPSPSSSPTSKNYGLHSELRKLYIEVCQRNSCKPNSQFLKQLQRRSTVGFMDFSENYIGGDKAFRCVLEVIQNNTELKVLNLSNNFLTSEQITLLVNTLITHPSLTRLILLNNNLYVHAAKELLRLTRLNSKITELTLIANSPDPEPAPVTHPLKGGFYHRNTNQIPIALVSKLLSQTNQNYITQRRMSSRPPSRQK